MAASVVVVGNIACYATQRNGKNRPAMLQGTFLLIVYLASGQPMTPYGTSLWTYTVTQV